MGAGVRGAIDGVKELRSFGLIVGGIFAGIGFWPLVIRGSRVRWWGVALGGALLGAALACPRALNPVHRVWMTLAELLAWINTRLLLGLVFLVLVTPMALAMRIRGTDPMNRGFDRDAVTYRVGRRPRPAKHMLRQY
jgi:hypothetical protein